MSNNLYSMFRTDKAVESEGILVNYGDVRFRIARAGGGNQKFKKVFQQKAKPFRRQIDNELMSEEASDRLMAEVYAETVVLKWESLKKDEHDEAVRDEHGNEVWEPVFVTEDGTRLDFNEKNVVKVLLDLPELFADIKDMAAKASNYRKALSEADAGN